MTHIDIARSLAAQAKAGEESMRAQKRFKTLVGDEPAPSWVVDAREWRRYVLAIGRLGAVALAAKPKPVPTEEIVSAPNVRTGNNKRERTVHGVGWFAIRSNPKSDERSDELVILESGSIMRSRASYYFYDGGGVTRDVAVLGDDPEQDQRIWNIHLVSPSRNAAAFGPFTGLTEQANAAFRAVGEYMTARALMQFLASHDVAEQVQTQLEAEFAGEAA